jgi:hypothetical protein
VNTHVEYRRHRAQPPQAVPAPAEALANHLAVAGDPSGRSAPPVLSTPAGARIAWIRPTELHAHVGPLIGRGIDLQTELLRRGRGAPRRAARSLTRTLTQPVGAAPQPLTVPEEGLQL